MLHKNQEKTIRIEDIDETSRTICTIMDQVKLQETTSKFGLIRSV